LPGIKADGKYYVDKVLPMGQSQSANLFEKFSTFLYALLTLVRRSKVQVTITLKLKTVSGA
jgi:hypothetical protein